VARHVIETARGHGVAGWKVNGAGGNGGSVTLLCGPSASAPADLARQLEAEVPGVRVLRVRLDAMGVQAASSQPD
jgi:D-glycero-alpha-D-manno-heptose-7-phosphate kinase